MVPMGEPPRRSTRKGKVPTLPDNVYGDKPPAKVVHDIESKRTWRKMIENQPGSSWDDNSHDQSVPGEFPEQAGDPPIAQCYGPCRPNSVDKCWAHLAALWTLRTWTLRLEYGLVD